MAKKKNVNKKTQEIITVCLIGVFLVFISIRKLIFKEGSFMHDLYEPALAGNTLVKLIKTVVILAVSYLIMLTGKHISLYGDHTKNSTTKTSLLLAGNILKYVAAIAALLLTLSAWGVDTSAIVTGASVITLVIGLGCQAIVSDVVAGISMLFEGDIKVGDIVVINGWRGTVQQIGLRRTRIIDAVGNINIINNSSISNIINNTKDLSVAICDVGIEYSESIERVEEILKEHLPEFKEHIPAIIDGPYYKGVAELGDSSVVIKLIAKCTEEDKFQVQRDMNREVKILFDKYNVNIPFNQVVVNYRDEEGK